ncbi:MAG: hypothetical protein MI862_22755, partial [Desulfobacterales bacterium]|nr:hypothetical protein [Desulfobacterales bacterium]
DVLEELMRHHDTRLELAEKEMEKRRFTGTFDTYDLDEILEAIQLTFSLTGKETPGGTIVLRPRY